MTTIEPIPRALVPVDSAAADDLGAPNYDEFQSDREVWDLLQRRPASVLRITMAHCDSASPESIGAGDSEASLERAAASMRQLAADPRTREVRQVLWVYEIASPARAGPRQIGLGGFARTAEIRTDPNPHGPIIRNEGVREPKARGRARLMERTHAMLDAVNLAVEDRAGELEAALLAHADARPPAFETIDEAGCTHRAWLLEGHGATEPFRALLAREPLAFVADGNHRSAAAAMLGSPHFVAVFFPARTLQIAPYNRLVRTGPAFEEAHTAIESAFDIRPHGGAGAFQPTTTHEIGLYDGNRWWRLRPRPGSFDPDDAAQDIDADIVQRHLFAAAFGIEDARDTRLVFVGNNRDAAWLQARVDDGEYRYAVTLPAVTMDQFIRVCLQDRVMPPKSTWFEPKVRSGLVMALFD